MSMTRRSFIHTSAAAGALGLGFLPRAKASEFAQGKTEQPLKILILGGTAFLGPHIVRTAIDRGHTMTLFNRGRTNPHLFPDLEKLRGDRASDLSALENREWDAVIDTSAYYPRVVRMIHEVLGDAVGHYTLVSSISAYGQMPEPGMDESAPVATIEDETTEQVTGVSYGPLKALCEQSAEKAWPGRTFNVRPGLISGPGDPTDRFTYWPARIARGGEVMAPGEHTDPVQHIDVRDLAEWIIYAIENQVAGIYNATGPNLGMPMAELLYGCKGALGGDAHFTWVSAEFLEEHGVAPWQEMTVWIPPTSEMGGLGAVNVEKGLRNGLVVRPLAETARDTVDWLRDQPQERQEQQARGLNRETGRGAGISLERETELLAAWRSRDEQADVGEESTDEHG